MQVRSPKPCVRIHPTAGEPICPATFAQMLMNPIDTAATEADKVSVGNTQNGGGQKYANSPVRHSRPKNHHQGRPGRRLSARQTPVSTCPATQCHFRSPVQSDERPAS